MMKGFFTLLFSVTLVLAYSFSTEPDSTLKNTTPFVLEDDPVAQALDSMWADLSYIPINEVFRDSIDLGNPVFHDSVYALSLIHI